MSTATIGGLASDTMSISPPPPVVRPQSIENLSQIMGQLGFGSYNNIAADAAAPPAPEPKKEDDGGGMIMGGVLPHGPLTELMHVMHGAEMFRDETKKNQLPQGDPSTYLRLDGRTPADLTLESKLRNPYEELKPSAPAPRPRF